MTEKKRQLWQAVLLIALCVFFCSGLLFNLENWGRGDWDQHFFYLASAIKSIKSYGQLPLWNPWYCGGGVLFQNSQTWFPTPFNLFFLAFPTPVAIKICTIVHYAIALWGMVLIGRCLFGVRRLTLTVLASSLFVFNGMLTLHIDEGHTWMLTFAYIPWVYYFYTMYVRQHRLRFVFLSASIFSLMIFQGGIYPVPYTALFLTCYALLQTAVTRNFGHIKALVMVGLFTFLFAGVKLVPLYDFMSEYPRHINDVEGLPLGLLPLVFLSRNPQQAHNAFADLRWGWHEYGCYIGPPLLLLLSGALLLLLVSCIRNRSFVALILTFMIFVFLFLGDFHAYAPYSLLHQLPVFKSLHVPSRALIMITFIGSLLILALVALLEVGLDRIPSGRVRRVATFGLVVLLALIMIDLFMVNGRTYSKTFAYAPQRYPRIEARSPKSYQTVKSLPGYGAYSSMYPGLLANIATLDCYEPNQPRRGVNPRRGLIYAGDGGARIHRVRFSPNRIRFDARVSAETVIFLNQNYVRGWKFSLPDIRVESRSNRPAISLAPGTYRDVYFYFFPDSLAVGAAATLGGIVLAGIWLALEKRRPNWPPGTGPSGPGP